jgi:tRNA(adenine34) deaminase
MWILDRRAVIAVCAGAIAFLTGHGRAATDPERAAFVAQAFAMKQRAIDSGDQPYGAVVVRGGEIVGYGPSHVVINKDWTAHAEREAVRDAQARLGRSDLSDCVMYSTSRPCSDCQHAAAQARIARMYVGADAADAGAPRLRK